MVPTKYGTTTLTDAEKAQDTSYADVASRTQTDINGFESNYATMTLQEVLDKYTEKQTQPSSEERDYTTLMQVKEQIPQKGQEHSFDHRIGRAARAQRNIQPALNFRGKLILAVYACILVLLGSLMISNAMLMKSVSGEIELLNHSIAQEGVNISDIKRVYDILHRADNLTNRAYDANMAPVANSIYVNMLPLSQGQSVAAHTNWFNEVCNFISRLFGMGG